MKKTLIYVGTDGWNRPVYIDANGKLWKNVLLKREQVEGLFSVVDDDFYGEPLAPMKTDKEIVFKE